MFKDLITENFHSDLNLVLLFADELENGNSTIDYNRVKITPRLFYENQKALVGYSFKKSISQPIDYEKEDFS